LLRLLSFSKKPIAPIDVSASHQLLAEDIFFLSPAGIDYN